MAPNGSLSHRALTLTMKTCLKGKEDPGGNRGISDSGSPPWHPDFLSFIMFFCSRMALRSPLLPSSLPGEPHGVADSSVIEHMKTFSSCLLSYRCGRQSAPLRRREFCCHTGQASLISLTLSLSPLPPTHPLHPPSTFSQAWSSPGDPSHLRRWWPDPCSGTTGRRQTAAPWRATTWGSTSRHTG